MTELILIAEDHISHQWYKLDKELKNTPTVCCNLMNLLCFPYLKYSNESNLVKRLVRSINIRLEDSFRKEQFV